MKTNLLQPLLNLDPASSARLKRLEGKAINIKIRPFNCLLQCYVLDGKLCMESDASQEAEVTITGTPLQMMGVMLDKSNRQRFFAEDMAIEGQAEVAQQFTDLFDRLHIDWEEILAQVTGDVTAHHVGRTVRGMAAWVKQTTSQLREDISEYTQEEVHWFPTKEALHDFFNDIDALRMHVDRVEARINQLSGDIR